jgi:hypothetical protein
MLFMNVNSELQKYQDQINQMVVFAKSINFNPAVDDFDEFILEWVKQSVNFYSVNNQDSVYQMIKNIFRFTVK